MLDFAQLPPEVNSALMYAGPGSGPMLAAAAAWEALAAELQTTASTYDALITGLADGPWQGSIRGVHGGCRHAPGGVVEEHRRAGRASRQPSGGSGECL